ncbi:hypothetical protein K502DRAFT_352693 [Neoconidiobolus thromboides FSU 785]|nr:hypothetical protein K502DRAFT_352693 [Neoconidiobolus thromboides FSU 785]
MTNQAVIENHSLSKRFLPFFHKFNRKRNDASNFQEASEKPVKIGDKEHKVEVIKNECNGKFASWEWVEYENAIANHMDGSLGDKEWKAWNNGVNAVQHQFSGVCSESCEREVCKELQERARFAAQSGKCNSASVKAKDSDCAAGFAYNYSATIAGNVLDAVVKAKGALGKHK